MFYETVSTTVKTTLGWSKKTLDKVGLGLTNKQEGTLEFKQRLGRM